MVSGSVAYDSNYPETYGWPPIGEQAVNSTFTYTSPQGLTYKFPQGIAVGTEALFTAALDIICAQQGFECYPDTDPNVCGMWGGEIRQSTNSSDASLHSYYIACDINAPWNPDDTDAPAAGPYTLPRNTGDLVYSLGMRWGGDWGDWMHIEEHFTPDQCAQWTAENGGSIDPPQPEQDWFDMATKKDLQDVVTGALTALLTGKPNANMPAGSADAILDDMGLHGWLQRGVDASRTGHPNTAFPDPGSPKD